MFRRLAEAFENDDKSNHSSFIKGQNTQFNALPNMILSKTSGLKGFDIAIKNVSPTTKSYSEPAVKFPNNIFMSGTSPNLDALAKSCEASTIDQLIATKNPNAAVGCGWMYTPPNQGSPYPQVSKGFIGTQEGPLSEYNSAPAGTTEYKKWFFDLQLAKRQMLLDKCKSLKTCTDVDQSVYSGDCGYCTDINQGVPIDANGQPLYPDSSIGNCSPSSIVAQGSNCQPPAPAVGPTPATDNVCDLINGRLSAMCLYNNVLSAGCSEKGALAAALATTQTPNDYVSNLRSADSVKLYNRNANTPLNLDTFGQGATTVATVLQEVRQLASNANTNPATTQLGAAARDLCLQKGTLDNFDFCADLPDTTAPPFDIGCLQKLFLKLGGQPVGTAYPSNGTLYWTTNSTMPMYNSMANLGAVKQYLNTLIANMKSSDYTTQRNAMMQILGISPERLINRAPYQQGVEVFWFLITPGNQNKLQGFLKRTIETDIVKFAQGSTGNVPQLGIAGYTANVQLFDIRAPSDFAVKFQGFIDDGFFITANQPLSYDYYTYTSAANNVDTPGHFATNNIQAVNFASNSCTQFSGSTPNITKIFYNDAGGGGHGFQLLIPTCSGQFAFSPPYYSLTCEARAPFICFEVNKNTSNFEDTRNPGAFVQFISSANALEYHTRTDETSSVPGNKGFIRLDNSKSSIGIMNIAYQSWGTVSYAFRLKSMPVKDAIFNFWVYNKFCIFYLKPLSGSTSQMYVYTNMTNNGSTIDQPTAFKLDLNSWYYIEFAQTSNGFDVYCDTFDNIIKNNNYTTQYTSIKNNAPITTSINNGLYVPGQYSCFIGIGAATSATGFFQGTPGFTFDIAWMHFFDTYINGSDVVRDVKCNWIYTDFPDSLNTYKTI
jgi:hypothetical protein